MEKLFNKALEFYGLKEDKGEKHNSQILKFFTEIGHKWVKTDETAWCAAFVNYICLICNYEKTNKLNARSFLKVGWEIKDPKVGDICIFWRDSINSWKGHVGFFVKIEGNKVWVLGGNQSNMVKISAYEKEKVLGYRRLKSF